MIKVYFVQSVTRELCKYNFPARTLKVLVIKIIIYSEYLSVN